MASFAFTPPVDPGGIYSPAPFAGSSPSDAALQGVIYQVRQLMATSGANSGVFQAGGGTGPPSAETVRASGPASLRTLVTLVDAGGAADVTLTLAAGTEGQTKTVLLLQPLTRCRVVTQRGAVLLDGAQQCARLIFVGGRWYLLPDGGVASSVLAAFQPVAPALAPPAMGFAVLGAHVSYTGNTVWAWSAEGALGVWSTRGPPQWALGAGDAAGALGVLSSPLAGAWVHAADGEMLALAGRTLLWMPLDDAGSYRPLLGRTVATALPALCTVVAVAPDLSWLLLDTGQVWARQQSPAATYAAVPGVSLGARVRAADISFGGALVAALEDGTVLVCADRSLASRTQLTPPLAGAGAVAGLGRHAVAISPTGRTAVVACDAGALLVYTDGGPAPSALVEVPPSASSSACDSLVVRDNLILAGVRAACAVYALVPAEGGAAPGLGLGWQPSAVFAGRDTFRDPGFGRLARLSLDGSTLLCPGSLAPDSGPMYLFS